MSKRYRSSHRRCSVRKGVPRNLSKFTGRHFFTEHLWTAASGSIEINLEDFLQMIIKISCEEVLLKIKLLLQKNASNKIHVCCCDC